MFAKQIGDLLFPELDGLKIDDNEGKGPVFITATAGGAEPIQVALDVDGVDALITALQEARNTVLK